MEHVHCCRPAGSLAAVAVASGDSMTPQSDDALRAQIAARAALILGLAIGFAAGFAAALIFT